MLNEGARSHFEYREENGEAIIDTDHGNSEDVKLI
jgi:hypothetical protein